LIFSDIILTGFLADFDAIDHVLIDMVAKDLTVMSFVLVDYALLVGFCQHWILGFFLLFYYNENLDIIILSPHNVASNFWELLGFLF
jgi:hypothetical protein